MNKKVNCGGQTRRLICGCGYNISASGDPGRNTNMVGGAMGSHKPESDSPRIQYYTFITQNYHTTIFS